MALPVPEYEYDYEQYEYDHERNRRRARLVDEPEPGPELYHAEDDDSDHWVPLRALSGTVPCLDVGKAFDVFNAVAPEGWRVELIEGDIHVTPPPNGENETILSEMNRQVIPKLPDNRLLTYTGIGLNLPGASRTGHVEPDFVIALRGSIAPEAYYHDPSGVLLVCEVTSRSTAANDRAKKILGYARAGIPVYLLIDRQVEGGAIFVYSKPEGDSYTRQEKYTSSQTVPLPDPLGFEIDTSGF
ncbi:Uma2 family endonuclease [Streptomyces sp. CB03238]|uniref:Uma2 family endonuclease n=1 Tax=Streptomyces sp. CB03238 TaxID=1907777 RepID=UPI000A1145F2|nr:Uma2 family endonuclease [Streptomyces sp. CB03238]ORT58852.1 hypothetical protein BKD26_16930 [Streptomyces sp. CB03238]